jgi:hypothetical protein
MERSPIFLIEPVPGIKRQELDLGSFGQIGRLVNDESPGLHSSLQRHVITVAPRPLLHNSVRAANRMGGIRTSIFLRHRPRRKLAAVFGEGGS